MPISDVWVFAETFAVLRLDARLAGPPTQRVGPSRLTVECTSGGGRSERRVVERDGWDGTRSSRGKHTKTRTRTRTRTTNANANANALEGGDWCVSQDEYDADDGDDGDDDGDVHDDDVFHGDSRRGG